MLQEGYAESFDELVRETEWSRYGHASGNPKCGNCMMHSGFEASAVNDTFSSLRGLLATVRAMLFGPRTAETAGRRSETAGRRSETAGRPVETSARPVETLPVIQGPPARRGDRTAGDRAALRRAFDYRGDVTLHLDDGASLQGFVANLTREEVVLMERGTSAPRRVSPDRVRGVEFSGRDMAAPASA